VTGHLHACLSTTTHHHPNLPPHQIKLWIAAPLDPGEDPGSERGDAARGVSAVHGQDRARGPHDRHRDPGGTSARHHGQYDCRGDAECTVSKRHKRTITLGVVYQRTTLA
jgi:hypothetical protein